MPSDRKIDGDLSKVECPRCGGVDVDGGYFGFTDCVLCYGTNSVNSDLATAYALISNVGESVSRETALSLRKDYDAQA